MVDLDGMMKAGLSSLNQQRGGDTFEYRSGKSGAWTALSVADFHESDHRLEPGGFIDGREERVRTATLKTSLDATALAIGYQIRRNASDTDIWGVTDGPSGSLHRVYTLERVTDTRYGADRGRAR